MLYGEYVKTLLCFESTKECKNIVLEIGAYS